VAAKVARIENSMLQVRIISRDNDIANGYSAFITACANTYLTESQKTKIVNELAQYLHAEVESSNVFDEVFGTKPNNNSNKWASYDIANFDRAYSRCAGLSLTYDTNGKIANEIRKSVSGKSLAEIMVKVNEYKALGL